MGWRQKNLNFENLSRFLITFSQENLREEMATPFARSTSSHKHAT